MYHFHIALSYANNTGFDRNGEYFHVSSLNKSDVWKDLSFNL